MNERIANADNSEQGIMPSELRWMLTKRDPESGDTPLLLRCLKTMDRYMKELERLRRENKCYGRYFLETAAVVDAFRADDRSALGKALREQGKAFDAITGDRDALEAAVVPKPGPPQAPDYGREVRGG